MGKILFLSASDLESKQSGGKQVSFRNYNLLQKNKKTDLVYFSRNLKKEIHEENKYVYKSTKNKIHTFFNNLVLYSGYLTNSSEKKVLKLLQKYEYSVIFLDTSNYGRIIKKINSNIKIITFFHNVEYDYARERIKVDGFLYIPQFFASYYNEKLAVKYSDYCITLNSRDTRRLYEVYKRKSNLELPVTFEDKYSENTNNSLKEKDYILFVGSLFFANYHGIKWFVENVMPHINKKLLIVGKDFETKKSELTRKNVEIIGSVGDLTPYYLNASCMVMPIFEGAGMKVKTAEALMYGKTIYGTTEAFEGYEVEYNKIGGLCNTKEEFIEKINNDKNIVFNEYSRKVFLEKYSFESSINRMKEFLEKENLI